ncbi:hypothetical protein XENTR_v10016240 [Xenopus tropicalis]|uniref:CKLF-like MARVEL transmembrane domain-containing 7 n=1 Tax=Xenopus tropicalis TaxID=8364 RepID=F7AZ09_XENTR|eukprot:NP_001015861.1 CKLF-like MARVEL transmembrane domain-containing protein 7 [Xenopus tropicalis]
MARNMTVIRTTASSSNIPPPPSPGLLDTGYARSYSGMLKGAEMVSLLIGFLCVRFSIWTDYSAFNYFEIVTISFMILIFIFYVINIFRIYRMLTCISWPLAELLHYAIGIFLLFIASIVAAVKSYTISGLVVGSVFGFIATFLCVMDMWLSYKISFTAQSTGATL